MKPILKKQLAAALVLSTVACGMTTRYAASTLKSETASANGCDKADSMWNDKVLPSAYDMNNLPTLSGPGFADIVTFMSAAFVAKTITNNGDELEEGRRKLVHPWGTLVRVKLDPAPNATHSYTGLFASGAPCGIARFSLATAPTADNSVPAMAVKWFVGGEHESANIEVMYSIDGQSGHNFFENAFTNIIPDAQGFATRLLAFLFSRGAALAGAADTWSNHLKVTPMAAVTTAGADVESLNEPYKLVFQPTGYAQSIMDGATVDDDFRAKLAGIETGKTLYTVYAYASEDSEAELVGTLVTTSPVVAASYGDEKLFFKHTK